MEKKEGSKNDNCGCRSAVVVRVIDNFARRLYNMNIKEQVRKEANRPKNQDIDMLPMMQRLQILRYWIKSQIGSLFGVVGNSMKKSVDWTDDVKRAFCNESVTMISGSKSADKLFRRCSLQGSTTWQVSTWVG